MDNVVLVAIKTGEPFVDPKTGDLVDGLMSALTALCETHVHAAPAWEDFAVVSIGDKMFDRTHPLWTRNFKLSAPAPNVSTCHLRPSISDLEQHVEKLQESLRMAMLLMEGQHAST